jgi:hypothetical protein
MLKTIGSQRKRLLAIAAPALIASTALSVATAPTASAATARNGSCESGEFCYRNVDSISDFAGSISNYGTSPATCYVFIGGLFDDWCVKNQATEARNRTSHTVRVYYNSGYAGAYQDIPAGSGWVDLNSTLFRNNASHKFL